MKRLKTFFIYALVIAAFWFLSNLLIYLAINGTYKSIETKILQEKPIINVVESKATYVNGYIKGNIYNNTEEIITNKYLKIDLYSPRNVLLGNKYVKIENLESKKTIDFEMWYKYTDVGYCNVYIVDYADNIDEKAFISEETEYYVVLGFLITLFFI